MGKFLNKKNTNNNVNSNEPHSEYSDHIYVAESENKEILFDRNNPFVKIILLVLGSICFFGVLYYVFLALGTAK